MKAKESTHIHLIDYSLIVSDNLDKLQGSHLFLKGRLASSLKWLFPRRDICDSFWRFGNQILHQYLHVNALSHT